jgi:hypothetical protein
MVFSLWIGVIRFVCLLVVVISETLDRSRTRERASHKQQRLTLSSRAGATYKYSRRNDVTEVTEMRFQRGCA